MVFFIYNKNMTSFGHKSMLQTQMRSIDRATTWSDWIRTGYRPVDVVVTAYEYACTVESE